MCVAPNNLMMTSSCERPNYPC